MPEIQMILLDYKEFPELFSFRKHLITIQILIIQDELIAIVNEFNRLKLDPKEKRLKEIPKMNNFILNLEKEINSKSSLKKSKLIEIYNNLENEHIQYLNVHEMENENDFETAILKGLVKGKLKKFHYNWNC